jgi:3-deoxy-7-phosphoheptulonate synthase
MMAEDDKAIQAQFMIYSFEKEDRAYDAFVSVLREQGLDYEEIRRDRVVVRIFGRVEPLLRDRLDRVSGRAGKLTLKRKGEERSADASGRPHGKFLIAGPCSVESEEQIDHIAAFLSRLGVQYLRGGAFKPRTSPESFQGIGRVGLKIMAAAAARYGMKVVTELMDRSQLDDVLPYADIIQIGSRNMFNYPLLTTLGAVDRPVLLKRGMAATIDEWAAAADYIVKGGNDKIILCERGIRTFEPRTRFTLDILAIPLAQRLTGLPVVADVSHAAGERSLVPPLMRAALAAGADGVMVEVHPEPDQALSDGVQSLSFAVFESLLKDLRAAKLL